MKILLVCSEGMSTSMLVQKMRQAAAERSIEVEIDAVSEVSLKKHIAGTQVLLLGPQVRYLLKQLAAEYEPAGVHVAVIDMVDYGRMNGAAVLEKALALAAQGS